MWLGLRTAIWRMLDVGKARDCLKFASCFWLSALMGIAHAQESPLASMAWLTGCWGEEGAESGTVEQWMAPAGGTMLGMSRTVKSGKTVTFEFMRLRINDEGKLVFIALPRGQGETTFTLISQVDQRAVFENPGHEFPQRVIYQKLSRDKLAARIEGMRNGALRGIDFPMTRTACPAAAS